MASIPFDWRLCLHDIAGSIAHVRMLGKQGVISEKEAEVITQGLLAIGDEVEQGKLHTARSRNDQVAQTLAAAKKTIGEFKSGK